VNRYVEMAIDQKLRNVMMVYTHCLMFAFNVIFCVLQDVKFVNMVNAFNAVKDLF